MFFENTPQVSIESINVISKFISSNTWGIKIKLKKNNKSLIKIYFGCLLTNVKIEKIRKNKIIKYPNIPNV